MGFLKDSSAKVPCAGPLEQERAAAFPNSATLLKNRFFKNYFYDFFFPHENSSEGPGIG